MNRFLPPVTHDYDSFLTFSSGLFWPLGLLAKNKQTACRLKPCNSGIAGEPVLVANGCESWAKGSLPASISHQLLIASRRERCSFWAPAHSWQSSSWSPCHCPSSRRLSGRDSGVLRGIIGAAATTGWIPSDRGLHVPPKTGRAKT